MAHMAVPYMCSLSRQLLSTRPLSIMLPTTLASATSSIACTLHPTSTAPRALQSRPSCTGSIPRWCFRDMRLVQLRLRIRRPFATNASQYHCLDSPGGLPLTAHLRRMSAVVRLMCLVSWYRVGQEVVETHTSSHPSRPGAASSAPCPSLLSAHTTPCSAWPA